MDEDNAVRCTKCKFYQITWDVEKPYGCSKLGFKSRIEPCVYVNQVSGNVCRSFFKKVTH